MYACHFLPAFGELTHSQQSTQRLDVVDQLRRSYFRSRMTSGSSSGKRKRIVLFIDDKVDIIGMIDRGSSLTAIAEKFGITKSTVSDIKKRWLSLKVAGAPIFTYTHEPDDNEIHNGCKTMLYYIRAWRVMSIMSFLYASIQEK